MPSPKTTQEQAPSKKASVDAVEGDSTVSKPTGARASVTDSTEATPPASKEVGGPRGLEPTRYGDWERNGRCYDF